MILHEKVNSEALAIHHEANAITVNLAQDQGFKSDPAQEMQTKREKLDPFAGEHWIKDLEAYQRLGKLSESRLDKLIDLLTVEWRQGWRHLATKTMRHARSLPRHSGQS